MIRLGQAIIAVLMKQLEAHEIIGSIKVLLRSGSLLSALGPCANRRAYIEGLRPHVNRLIACCNDANLPLSCLKARELLLFFDSPVSEDSIAQSFEDAVSRCAGIIESEMSLGAYFALSHDEAEAWTATKLFGDAVSDAFPSTDYELREETRCFALGLYTAAVFHLMRVLEIGLAAAAYNIGVPFADKSWSTIINNMKGELNRITNDPGKPAGWKDDEQFYSSVLARFTSLKNAWRNYTMHVKLRYDKEQAEDIFVVVGETMRQLATRFTEAP